jgi:hypothetical protein
LGYGRIIDISIGHITGVDITIGVIAGAGVVIVVSICVSAGRMTRVNVVIGIRAGTGILIDIRVGAGTFYRSCIGIDIGISAGAFYCARRCASVIGVNSGRILGHSNARDRKQSCNNARYYNFFHSIHSRVGLLYI